MKEINALDFEQEVLNGGKVVLDFYSSECPPCEALAPKFEALSKLYGEKVKFLKIFRQENRELAERYGVKSSPSLLFFDNGNPVMDTLTGGIKKSEIMQRLDAMLTEEEVKAIKALQQPIEAEYDVAIVGGGPAGLTAGIYLGQAKINTVLIDSALPGGYMGITHQVSNYPGFEKPQPGFMLAHYMSEQAKQSGIDFKVAVDVTGVDLEKKEILLDGMDVVRAKKIILATGTTPNPMNIPGEKELKGKGISYCATCDAKYYVDKDVVVIGGGNSAVEEAIYITKFARKVTMIHRSAKFRANEDAVNRLINNPKVEVVFNNKPAAFERRDDKMVTVVEHSDSGEQTEIVADGVFVFIGLKANVELIGGMRPETDDWGYLTTDDEMRTSVADVYAAGDVISKKFRQITTAVADGTIAAMSISKELN
jgi:thioredoxin reductase (NADPH)